MKHTTMTSQLSVGRSVSWLAKRDPQAPDNYLTLAESREGAVQNKKGDDYEI